MAAETVTRSIVVVLKTIYSDCDKNRYVQLRTYSVRYPKFDPNNYCTIYS